MDIHSVSLNAIVHISLCVSARTSISKRGSYNKRKAYSDYDLFIFPRAIVNTEGFFIGFSCRLFLHNALISAEAHKYNKNFSSRMITNL